MKSPVVYSGSAQSIMSLNRRAFLKLTGTTVVCACAGVLGASGCASRPASDTPTAPAESYRIQDGRVYLAMFKVGDLLDVGGAVKFALDGADGSERKVIVVCPGEEDYRAFADACTHNGKELNYLHGAGLLACCGRSSRFDLTGEVLRGPAEVALSRYRVWRQDGELVIEV
jgi:nitrite reductase/ring-hydroxylating ferredoxin subunit